MISFSLGKSQCWSVSGLQSYGFRWQSIGGIDCQSAHLSSSPSNTPSTILPQNHGQHHGSGQRHSHPRQDERHCVGTPGIDDET